MNEETFRKQLLDNLNSPSVKVVALTGEWGVGKTHFWKKTKESINEYQDFQTENARRISCSLYASLFGLKNKKELETRLLMSSASDEFGTESKSRRFVSSVKQATHWCTYHFGEQYKTIAAVGAVLEPFVFSSLVRDKLVVIDDFERAGKDFSVDELLGFVDTLINEQNCKVLLIFNKEKIEDKKDVWDRFHEKVIDIEMQLVRDTDLVYRIATEGFEFLKIKSRENEIKTVLNQLKISNIRTIRKLLIRFESFLKNIAEQDVRFVEDFSTLVFLALNCYGSFNSVYSFDEIKKCAISSLTRAITNTPKEFSEREQNLLKRFNSISGYLNFNGNVVELFNQFLENGLVNEEALKRYIESKKQENDGIQFNSKILDCCESLYWDRYLTQSKKEELLAEVQRGLKEGKYARPHSINQLLQAIKACNIDGGMSEREVLDLWLENLDTYSYEKLLDIQQECSEPLKSTIKDSLNTLLQSKKTNKTLDELCLSFIEKRGWTELDQKQLNSITVKEMEDFLVGHSEHWKDVVRYLIELKGNRYYFNQAHENFQKACELVLADDSGYSRRLKEVLQRLISSFDHS